MNSPQKLKDINLADLIPELKTVPEEYAKRVEPILRDLRSVGFDFTSLDNLRRSGLRYRSAVPILIDWLERMQDNDLKDSITRTLSVPWAKPAAALPLIREFRKASASAKGLKWAIGNALSIVADDSVFSEIAELVQDRSHGQAREMLAVALGNMKSPQAIPLLIRLLHDDDTVGHAIMALRKLKAKEAAGEIEPLLTHPRAWVRKEAKKAMAVLKT